MIRKAEDIEYILNIKNVKNINMRVGRDGKITVSANRYVWKSIIDEFVISKRTWIEKAIASVQKRQENQTHASDSECMTLFSELSDEVYEIFKSEIQKKPKIKVKDLKSAWGICHPKKGYITLSKALFAKPKRAVLYVIIHEYVHFLHPNHQKGFYERLYKAMPDYKECEKILRRQ